MEFLIRKTELRSILVFLILFYINIGSKAIFRFFNRYAENLLIEVICAMCIFMLLLLVNCYKRYSNIIWFSILFFLFLAVMSFKGSHIDYGLQKAFLGLLMPIFLFNFFYKKRWTQDQIIRYLVLAVLIIDLIGLGYKLTHGFFQRSVSFGLLGAITFGWMNGMAFLAIVLQKEKKLSHILFCIFFFLVILWTGSKGPLVGVVILCAIFFNRLFGKRISTKVFVFLFLVVAIFILKEYSKDVRSLRMITQFAEDPSDYTEGVGSGSFGLRLEFMKMSLELFSNNPIFGVGFGGWQDYNFFAFKYPHDIVLELLSETGLVGIVLLIILVVKVRSSNIVSYIGLFGLVALLFSGDFSYFRYAFYPLLMGYYLFREYDANQVNKKYIDEKGSKNIYSGSRAVY